MAEIVTIPCLSDNYAFLLHDPKTQATALIDAPEAAPILAEVSDRNWTLTDILITHHHDDHIAGAAELVAATGAKVWGHAQDAKRLPPLDHAVTEGDQVSIGNINGTVIEVSGHTIGHIAFHFPSLPAVFTADSLMALGCGRLFEGTPEQMWTSLTKLIALPPETVVCSGHEYTAANARFAQSVDPDNPALLARIAEVEEKRAAAKPTVPSLLSEELATNPFLRAAELKTALGMETADASQIFAEIRARKDRF